MFIHLFVFKGRTGTVVLLIKINNGSKFCSLTRLLSNLAKIFAPNLPFYIWEMVLVHNFPSLP